MMAFWVVEETSKEGSESIAALRQIDGCLDTRWIVLPTVAGREFFGSQDLLPVICLDDVKQVVSSMFRALDVPVRADTQSLASGKGDESGHDFGPVCAANAHSTVFTAPGKQRCIR